MQVELLDSSHPKQSAELKEALGDTSGDLRTDLDEILSKKLSQNSAFASSSSHPSAPDPGLQIEGIGLINLPLSEQDAKAIISSSRHAPFGHGERTVVDPNVRDTWELDPVKITFNNPAWVSFINDNVVPEVWRELGVVGRHNDGSCEFYKMLLYETGSHFLPHQDTQKSPGMFATVIIVLPSAYTGGEVHVSLGSKEKAFDFAQNSGSTTSVFAWYTDVVHSVKPITSGYRLALSYNLIFRSHNSRQLAPQPVHSSLPRLRKILTAWHRGLYPSSHDVLAYSLDHQYSINELKTGRAGLKGQDAYLVSNIADVAWECGYDIFLANIDLHVTGDADDFEDSEEMVEETNREVGINNVVDLDGFEVDIDTSCLDEDDLISKGAFEEEAPNDKAIEYTGNEGATIELWYNRTVLMLVHFDNLHRIDYENPRLKRIITKVLNAKPNKPTKMQRTLYEQACNEPTTRYGITQWDGMASIAVHWKNIDKWCEIVKARGAMGSTLGPGQVAKGIEAFPLDRVLPVIEQALTDVKHMRSKLDVIQEVAEACPLDTDTIPKWCQARRLQAAAEVDVWSFADINSLKSVIDSDGFEPVMKRISHRLQKPSGCYNFWSSFVSLLVTYKETASEADRTRCDEIIDYTIKNQMIPKWDGGYQSAYLMNSYPQRVTDMIDLFYKIGHQKYLKDLLNQLLSPLEEIPNRLNKVYVPLVTPLLNTISQHHKGARPSEVSDFLRQIICWYLKEKLGSKPEIMETARPLGCGCEECQQLDRFLTKSGESSHTFSVVLVRRRHLIQRLEAGKDIVSYEVIARGSPHKLVVQKIPAVAAAFDWSSRHSAAEKFLSKFGDEDSMKELMGDRYQDVEAALDGIRPFHMDHTQSDPESVPGDENASSDSNTTSEGTSLEGQHGKKRKHPESV
ncbi:hypothetical protein AX16_002304 [Volvariella volvacea WC 439]|nr:hypothetical protein AX16_002304 [Volvariella volvacea WC 439]